MERGLIKEGKCHKCAKWIAVEGVKQAECKVPELFWYAFHHPHTYTHDQLI